MRYSAVMTSGCMRSIVCANALANVQTSFCAGPRSIGTYTWMPDDPDVFAYAGMPSCSSASCTSSAVLRTVANDVPPPLTGSRSKCR